MSRRSGAGPRLARQPRHPRGRGTGVHRNSDTAARRDIETVRHRGDLSVAVRLVHARGRRAAARSTAAAGNYHCRHFMEHRRGAVDVRSGLHRGRARQACARIVSGADAASRGVAHDGIARAGRVDGTGRDAGAGHPGDRHRRGSADRAAVRHRRSSAARCNYRRRRSGAKLAGDPAGRADGRRSHSLDLRAGRDPAAKGGRSTASISSFCSCSSAR